MLPGVYCSAPPLQTWVANNSAPHIRRATALAIFLIHTNSGGILATWLLGFLSPAPKYHKASLTLLIFSIILLVVSIINLFYLKHRNLFRSVSAFAPISNPTNAPWGHTAFSGYLKGGIEEGKEYDPTELIQSASDLGGIQILVDYGDADNFYKQKQLLPENFVEAAKKVGLPTSQVTVRRQPGYDHSYYFVRTLRYTMLRVHADHDPLRSRRLRRSISNSMPSS